MTGNMSGRTMNENQTENQATNDHGLFRAFPLLDEDKIYRAIREGVHDAIWHMITNATQMPCADFYDTIKDAAREAFSKMGSN
jgi:hypothetical protein